MHKHLLAFVFCLGVATGVTAGEVPAVGSSLTQRLERALQVKPDDIDTLHQLAGALMQMARTSPDTRVTARADSVIDQALARAPKHARSWALKAWSQMSRHQFIEALASTREAQRLEPGESLSLGLLVDALVELGLYGEAVEKTQAMVDRTPGLPSYSRAAHLRFLFGDTAGAIELMRLAASAGQPQSEEVVWVWLQLAQLYLQSGQIDSAEQVVDAATTARPQWHPVLAQLGKVRIAQARYDEALVLFQAATQKQPTPENVLAMWSAAQQAGNAREVKRAEKLLNALALLDEKNGGLSRRIFVEYLTHNPKRLADAEKLARKDLQVRPDIFGQDALAWVLFRRGKHDEAAQHMALAMRLGTHDVMLTQHAAEINGEKVASNEQGTP